MSRGGGRGARAGGGTMTSVRRESRERRAVEGFKCASEDIGELSRGMCLFAVTRGQWSMIDAALHCLDQVGRSKISVWTWAIASYEVDILNRLRTDDRLSAGKLIVDGSIRTIQKKYNANGVQDWKKTFGGDSVRYVVNHSKMIRIHSESGYRLLLRGSMNLNFNPRFEQFDLSEGGPEFDLVESLEVDLPVLPDSCSMSDTFAASKAGRAFNDSTLALFGRVKVWAK